MRADAYNTPNGTTFKFYLTGSIKSAKSLSELITALREAGPDDEIHIYINSPGGSLTTTMQVINAMSTSAARVVTIADGQVCSGAALIFFSGHELIIHRWAWFMMHGPQTASGYRSAHSMSRELDIVSSVTDDLAQATYMRWLTEDEVKMHNTGGDVYIKAEDMAKRLSKEDEDAVDNG